jgi:hypothetical protein
MSEVNNEDISVCPYPIKPTSEIINEIADSYMHNFSTGQANCYININRRDNYE